MNDEYIERYKKEQKSENEIDRKVSDFELIKKTYNYFCSKESDYVINQYFSKKGYSFKEAFKKSEKVKNKTRKIFGTIKYLIEDYIRIENYLFLLSKAGVDKTVINKIKRYSLIKNPIKKINRILNREKNFRIPINKSSMDSLENFTLKTILKHPEIIFEDKYNYYEMSMTASLSEIFDDKDVMRRLCHVLCLQYNDSEIKYIEITSSPLGIELVKYEKIAREYKENVNTNKEIRLNLSNISRNYYKAKKYLRELLILEKLHVPDLFSVPYIANSSMKRVVENRCKVLEKRVKKLIKEMDKQYVMINNDKQYDTINNDKKLHKNNSQKTENNVSLSSGSEEELKTAKNELEKLYSEIQEARYILANLDAKYEEYEKENSRNNYSYAWIRIETKSEFSFNYRNLISENTKAIIAILIKYPELNDPKYNVSINDEIKNIKEHYQSQDKKKQDAFKYKVYREYIIYISNLKSKKKRISFEQFSEEKYGISLEVPEEFKSYYEETTSKKKR